MYFYRTQHGSEVDVVLVKGIYPIATVEIKYSNSPVLSRGVYESIGDLGSNKNFIITPNSKTVLSKEGMLTVSLLEFSKVELPLLG